MSVPISDLSARRSDPASPPGLDLAVWYDDTGISLPCSEPAPSRPEFPSRGEFMLRDTGSLVKLALALTPTVRRPASVPSGGMILSSWTCEGASTTRSSSIPVRRLGRVRKAPYPGSVDMRTCPIDLRLCSPGGLLPSRTTSSRWYWYMVSAVLKLAADSDTCHVTCKIEGCGSILTC